MVFSSVLDRNKKQILSVRDQNTFDNELRQKRLMTLLHLFLLNRYKVDEVHYLTPTNDNEMQCQGMKKLGIYTHSYSEIGHIIVADVQVKMVKSFIDDEEVLIRLINKEKVELVS